MKVVVGIVLAFLVIVVIGISLLAAGAHQAVKTVDQSVKQQQQQDQSKDQLLQAMLNKAPAPVVHKDEYSYSVEYTLTNNTKENFDYIQLNADVFDKNGVKLGNDMTNITDVKAGQVFKLKLDFYQQDSNSYRVTGISSTPH